MRRFPPPLVEPTVRFDVGTTLVRYLSNHPDPNMSPINDLRSTQYIVTQGNSRSQPPACTASRLTDCRLRRRYSHSPLRTSFGEARKRRTWQPQSGVVPLSRTRKRAALAAVDPL